jgi:hypothetical protein
MVPWNSYDGRFSAWDATYRPGPPTFDTRHFARGSTSRTVQKLFVVSGTVNITFYAMLQVSDVGQSWLVGEVNTAVHLRLEAKRCRAAGVLGLLAPRLAGTVFLPSAEFARLSPYSPRVAPFPLMWRLIRQGKSIPEQGKWLRQVVTGFFNYHAVPTNWAALGAFRAEITERWRRTLSRRSQKGDLTMVRMAKLADDWLPKPRILHPWPNQRFAVKHPR